MDLPTADDLISLGHFWDGDQAINPNGDTYWKFMIFQYKKRVYVVENNWNPTKSGWELNPVVKKLGDL